MKQTLRRGKRMEERKVCENCLFNDKVDYMGNGWCDEKEDYVRWSDCCIAWKERYKKDENV